MVVKKQLGLFILAVSQILCRVLATCVNDTELILTFLVHRHGDRTPVLPDFSFSNNPEALSKIVEKYGYGQLTPRGKYRGYQIGQFIRRRYPFLSPRYNESEIYIRSTDITRTKMTALTSMAAVYPAEKDNWSCNINWTPVPYTTVPTEKDFMLSFLSCPRYYRYFTTFKPSLTDSQDILRLWSNITGENFTDAYKVYYTYDQYYCQQNLGIPLNSDLQKILPDIEKVAAGAMERIFGNKEYLPLLTGVLLKEFFDTALSFMNGVQSPRLRVYSCHDVNVYGMIAASRIQLEARPGVPKYGSIFGLELRKTKTGQYVVLPIYVADPDKDELVYLPIEGCTQFCDFKYFNKITRKFTLSQAAWEQQCKES